MTVDDNLLPSLQAFLVYWQKKRQLDPLKPKTLIAVESAKKDFLASVPATLNGQRLLADWEHEFQDMDTDFHHQGG